MVHVPVIHNQGRVNPVICRGNVHLTAVDIQDTVAVQPSQFGLPPEQAITNELNKKYANRVLHDVGLCVCVFDLAEVGEGKVRYGDGCLWYKGLCSTPLYEEQSQTNANVSFHSCIPARCI